MSVMVIIGAVTLDRHPKSVTFARRYVRTLLEVAGAARDLDSVLLVVSELMTNAVDHGAGERVSLLVAESDDLVRVEVGDAGHPGRKPQLSTDVDPDEERGRGLFLVEAVSDTWGVTTGPGRTTVWAEVPTTRH